MTVIPEKKLAAWQAARVSLLNLVPDVEFQSVVEEGLAEYIGRYKKAATIRGIFPEALNYLQTFTGDEAYERGYDKYRYDQGKKNAINLEDRENDALEALAEKLRQTSSNLDIADYWSKRSAGVAALFLYCNYLINHQGRKFVVEPEDAHVYRAVGAAQ